MITCPFNIYPLKGLVTHKRISLDEDLRRLKFYCENTFLYGKFIALPPFQKLRSRHDHSYCLGRTSINETKKKTIFRS